MQAAVREKWEKYGKYGWKTVNILAFLLMPVVSYLAFEYVTGNLATIPLDMAVLNILWIGALYLAVFAFCQTTRIAVPLVSVLLFGVSLAETFVESFRGTPIMIWEVLAVRTAMTVAGNYHFEFSERMKYAGAALAALNVLLWFFPVRVRGWRKRLAAGILGFSCAAGFAANFYLQIVPFKMLGINMWAINDTYQQYGYLLSTAVSLKYVVKTPPHGYSLARLEEIYLEIEEDLAEEEAGAKEKVMAEGGAESKEKALAKGDAEESGEAKSRALLVPGDGQGVQPVNLICIMNESLSELKVVGDFTTNQEYLPFIGNLRENTVRGNLCVPVFGAMTSNTEFEFLTGDSMAMLPSGSIAYQFYVKPGACTLVSTLKEQGYYSVAMHPFPRENWNRDKCYRNMGFDEFWDYDSYGDSFLIRNYVSDRSDYQKIIQAVEDKEHPDDRLFVFNVTMQNHGGYDVLYEDFRQEVYLTGGARGKYPKADQYLSLMKESDEAFRELLEYFKECEEPTMILLFGDHQPGVEDEFFDEIAGKASSQMSAPEQLVWYQTPFIIWTNYGQPYQDLGDLGAVYLSSYLLKLAGLRLTPYHQFLLEMAESLPVVHPIGFFAPDGTYYGWPEAESEQCPYQKTVLEYECLVYNHSLAGRTVEKLFSLPSVGTGR